MLKLMINYFHCIIEIRGEKRIKLVYHANISLHKILRERTTFGMLFMGTHLTTLCEV